MIAEVIVDIASSDVDRIFEYEINNLEVEKGSRVTVPFGNKFLEGFVIGIKNKPDFDINKIKNISAILDDKPPITLEGLSLAEFICKKYHISKALALRLFLPTEMRKGRIKGKIVKFITLNEEIPLISMMEGLKSTAKTQKAILGYVSVEKKVGLTILNEKFGSSAVRTLLQREFLISTDEKSNRTPYSELENEDKQIVLTLEQKEVISNIEKNDGIFLLHGVTGSGKTEVYLSCINKVIEEGKTAIMLVPEIALTPQMLRQLRARFKDKAALLHSGLTPGEKYDEWQRLRNKEAVIAIGARSAIFAPLENVGLIIIDEEHDGSYSSETCPRYNTIDIARFRCNYNNSKLILGSATPSIESYLKAKQGKYKLLELPNRINKKPMPEIIISDMRQEVRRGNHSQFSRNLITELERCLDNNNQAIIFLNRRGFSKTLICEDCGYVAKCENCDVSLTYHKDENLLKCHYCNAKYKVLSKCPECGSELFKYGAMGTEKIVFELQKLFPDAKILRMDNDTTRNKEGHFKIINEFANHNADILVGTQMIAKGHDFPSVTLVGILDADMSLHFADYRSGERTFQLITQVAGRSGRALDKGKVILQTFTPDNYILNYAINYDYKGFFERECSLRQATLFPPYSLILRGMVTGDDEKKVIAKLDLIFQNLKQLFDENYDDFIFFGKSKSPIKRIENKFRYQILMRVKSRKLVDMVYEIVLKEKDRDVLCYVEENPSNMI